MEISRKTDYALRMLAELVKNEDGGVLSVRAVAEKNNVPYSFARSIQHDLTTSGVVESTRGSRGGMKLIADPDKLTLREVVEIVQGPILVSTCDYCEDDGPCRFREECHFNPIWCEAERILRAFFSSVTLRQVVQDRCMPTLSEGSHFITVRSRPRVNGVLVPPVALDENKKPASQETATAELRPAADNFHPAAVASAS